MCTLIVATGRWPELPLLVAANRDERLDRPALPPSIRRDGRAVPVLIPTDVVAGGTWIGLSARGVFAGLTNRFHTPPDPARSSRGEIVLRALDEPDAESGAAAIARLDPRRYNAFHLIVADRVSAHVLVCAGDAIHATRLAPGLHIATERSFGAAPAAREALIRERFAAIERESGSPPDDAALHGLLSIHAGIDGTCVHLDDLGYGTRSSTILRLPSGAPATLLHAEGPPCVNPHRPVDAAF